VNLLDRIFRRAPRPVLNTGRVLTCQEVIEQVGFPVHTADDTYDQVTRAWLDVFYADYKETLFRQGVVHWEPTFDCDNFASFYVALANVRHFTATWGRSDAAQSLALAEYWYRPNGGTAGHAIVLALTEYGQVFIEPQSGREIHLSADEQQTRYLVKF